MTKKSTVIVTKERKKVLFIFNKVDETIAGTIKKITKVISSIEWKNHPTFKD